MRWTLSLRAIPEIGVDRAKLRGTLSYRFTPRFHAGVEVNPRADDVGPIANWLAWREKGARPALIVGTSSDRIGTSHGRAGYATLSKDLEAWTDLPIAPYAGVAFGSFDDEWEAIGGLNVRWGERVSSTSIWDGHNLHHTLDVALGSRHTLGLVLVDLEGERELGLSYALSW